MRILAYLLPAIMSQYKNYRLITLVVPSVTCRMNAFTRYTIWVRPNLQYAGIASDYSHPKQLRAKPTHERNLVKETVHIYEYFVKMCRPNHFLDLSQNRMRTSIGYHSNERLINH